METPYIQDYKMTKLLGKGSYSNVYKVEKDGKEYALKRVDMSKLSDVDKQFALNEVRFLSSLDIENVTKMHDVFYQDEDDSLCMVLEYAAQGDARAIIDKHHKESEEKNRFMFIPEETIWVILLQCLKGLYELDLQNIVHRDIKTENIFVYDDNKIKIGDFNITLVSFEGIIINQNGTPYYAAPEIYRNHDATHKSDIWSLGICALEL